VGGCAAHVGVTVGDGFIAWGFIKQSRRCRRRRRRRGRWQRRTLRHRPQSCRRRRFFFPNP